MMITAMPAMAQELYDYILFAEDANPVKCKLAMDSADTWYLEAHEYAVGLARAYGVTVPQAVGIMAAMSIRQHWSRNKINASKYLAWWNGAIEAPACLGISIHKCSAIMFLEDGYDEQAIVDILHGMKITSFFHNIMHPLTSPHATIDSWMAKAWKEYRGSKRPTRSVVRLMKEAVEYVAMKLGWAVPRLQAYVWTLVRGRSY